MKCEEFVNIDQIRYSLWITVALFVCYSLVLHTLFTLFLSVDECANLLDLLFEGVVVFYLLFNFFT